MRTRHLFVAALTFLTVPASALADTLPPPPAAAPAPAGIDTPPAKTAVTGPEKLHEIGHVSAKTSFCTAFSAGAAPAAESAIRFQQRLAITAADLGALDMRHELPKMRVIRLLEDDALALALDARDGRGELATMRKKALTDPDPNSAANAELIAFADALRGAQGREYELSRQIANLVGTLEEIPVPTIGAGSSDAVDSFARSQYTRAGLITDTTVGGASPIQNHLFAIPSNGLIEDDLEDAGARAEAVETLAACR